MNTNLSLIVFQLLLVSCHSLGSTTLKESTTADRRELPRDLETELALSAAPAHIAQDAGVYLYSNTKGFVLAKKSENGFTCMVARTDIQVLPLLDVKEYRDDVLIPICYDRQGSKKILPTWILAETLRIKGLSAEDMIAQLAKTVQAPKRSGLSPMISPFMRTHPGPVPQVVNLNYPHYMFYAPGLSISDVHGTHADSSHPWVDNEHNHNGQNAYLMQALGLAERLQRNKKFKKLLTRLCELKKYCDFFDFESNAPESFARTNAKIVNRLKKIIQ